WGGRGGSRGAPMKAGPAVSRTHDPRPMACMFVTSPRPTAHHHDLGGVEEHDEIEDGRRVLDVIDVVRQLLLRVLDGRAVGVSNLRPPGQSGADQSADVIEWDCLGENGGGTGPLPPPAAQGP